MASRAEKARRERTRRRGGHIATLPSRPWHRRKQRRRNPLDRNLKLAIGAGLGLGVLLGAAYAIGSAGASAAGGAANQLPPAPSPKPTPSPSPPVPPPGPPPPPSFDPTKVTPGTTFTGILSIQPDPTSSTTTPASFDDMSQLLTKANMTPSFAADGSSPGQWTVVATYNGTNPTIDLTKTEIAHYVDGRQYIASWSQLSTVGANV
jgi:hypothetical protein